MLAEGREGEEWAGDGGRRMVFWVCGRIGRMVWKLCGIGGLRGGKTRLHDVWRGNCRCFKVLLNLQIASNCDF